MKYLTEHELRNYKVGDEIGITHDYGSDEYHEWSVSTIKSFSKRTLTGRGTLTLENGKRFNFSSGREYGTGNSVYSRSLVSASIVSDHNKDVAANIKKRDLCNEVKEMAHNVYLKRVRFCVNSDLKKLEALKVALTEFLDE